MGNIILWKQENMLPFKVNILFKEIILKVILTIESTKLSVNEEFS